MKATWNGTTIAESTDIVEVEGNPYFPLGSVDQALLRDSEHKTTCFWKGVASYYSIEVDGQVNENAAWYYADPKPEASMVKGRVAFWRGVEIVD